MEHTENLDTPAEMLEHEDVQALIGDISYDKACREFQRILDKDAQEAYRYYGLTMLHSLKGQDFVRERWRLGIKPHDPKSLYNLGVLCTEAQAFERALDWYKESEARGGCFPELFYNMFLTYHDLNDAVQAQKYAERCVQAMRDAEDQEEYEEDIVLIRTWLREQGGLVENR